MTPGNLTSAGASSATLPAAPSPSRRQFSSGPRAPRGRPRPATLTSSALRPRPASPAAASSDGRLLQPAILDHCGQEICLTVMFGLSAAPNQPRNQLQPASRSGLSAEESSGTSAGRSSCCRCSRPGIRRTGRRVRCWDSPLFGAGVECADAAARNQQVELITGRRRRC